MAGVFGLDEPGACSRPGVRSSHEVEGDVVEHDRHDDLVGARARLEESGDAGPERAADEAADQGHEHVDAPRELEPEGDPSGDRCRDEHLAATADVEHADAECERDAQASRDERRGERERLGQRPDAVDEGVPAEVVDRPLEQCRVGARHRIPDREERVGGPREEVAAGLLHPLVGERDHDRADDEGEQHGEHRDDRVAGRDLAQRGVPSGRRRHVGAR
jgi:hypothetical protein